MGKAPQFKIYQGILCLELRTPHGRHWWAQGYGLGFSPLPLAAVQGVRAGKLEGSGKRVLAVRTEVDGHMSWVAVNALRSDVAALVAQGWWPEGWALPYDLPPPYTPPPQDLA
ncbi:MAG: hypothetical protein H6922_02935 [Pseudomonadaceae bacterium]|nr:hypothetical protein [Pseudomonadaceae bacterium]